MKLFQRNTLMAVVMAGIVFAVSTYSDPVVTLFFRDSVTVSDTMIYLSDIAAVSSESPAIAGQIASTVAGESAPPGYSRFIGPDEVLRFRLQPMFKSVVFKINTTSRISVRTSSVDKKIGDFSDQIREYVRHHCDWKEGEWSFALLNSETSWKCLDRPLTVSVEGLKHRFPRGEIQLQLIAKQGIRTFRLPVVCRISVKLPVCVAKHDVRRGKIIDSNDLETKVIDLSGYGFTPIVTMHEAVGKKAARSFIAGTVLHDRLLFALPVVTKGDPLTIVMVKGRVRISVSAIARENGFAGQKIWVENAATHRLIRAAIRDKYTVELL